MKIIALAALGMFCALTGQYIAYRLEKRVKMLEKLQVMLCIIENDIQYLCRPACDIIFELAMREELDTLTFLKVCSKKMAVGIDFLPAWKESVNGHDNLKYLEKGDVSMLISFGGLFGMTDADGQISNCRLHSELLKDKLEDARQKRDRYASLMCGLGVITGIGIIIILI